MDITCRKCGEPWDAYCQHDGTFSPKEWKAFTSGQGCPSCMFGTICTHCRGTGMERARSILSPDCLHCHGDRYLIVRYFNGEYSYGYWPNTKHLDRLPRVIEDYGMHESRNGRQFREYRVICPFCERRTDIEKCFDCGGSGKFREPNEDVQEARTENFLESSLEATDDPESLGWMQEGLPGI